MRIVNPLRQELEDPDGAMASDAFAGTDGGALYSSMRVPVRYKNRSSSNADIAAASLSGDYYIQLTTGFKADPYADSYVLRVGLVGKATPGPRYLTPVASGSPGPSTPASSTPGSSTDGARSAGPSMAAASDDSGGISTPVLLGGVVGVAVLIALAITVALRRRRSEDQARSHT